MDTQTVSVRELQHNLSAYLDKVATKPLTITKHGKVKAVLMSPEKYSTTTKTANTPKRQSLLDSPIVGMYKNRKDWKGKTSAQISMELREKAWYGK